MPHLTAVVLTYNEASNIVECLSTLAFCDVRVVFDSGSTDGTQALADGCGARVLTHPFVDYASQRNAALDAVAAETTYVLFIDADERVPSALADEIRAAVAAGGYAGWRVPRHNIIFGRLTLGGLWYPDHQTRLLKVGVARWDPSRRVHETVLLDGPLGTLHTPLVHHSHRNVRHFMSKTRHYTTLEANVLYGQGVRPKPWSVVSMPLRMFWWHFVTQKGYRDRLHGVRLGLLLMVYEVLKWRKLGALWRHAQPAPNPDANV